MTFFYLNRNKNVTRISKYFFPQTTNEPFTYILQIEIPFKSISFYKYYLSRFLDIDL